MQVNLKSNVYQFDSGVAVDINEVIIVGKAYITTSYDLLRPHFIIKMRNGTTETIFGAEEFFMYDEVQDLKRVSPEITFAAAEENLKALNDDRRGFIDMWEKFAT